MAVTERKSDIQPMDSILDTISNVPAATSSQDLAWRLTTVYKLDHLSSHASSATSTVSTEPSQAGIVAQILDVLDPLRSSASERLPAKLAEIASIVVKLWSALRKDSCRIEFDYDPSTGNWQEWDFGEDAAINNSMAANLPKEIPANQLPSKSFMLFPRITGSFESTGTNPRILHAGLALPQDSPAFRIGLQEIQHIHHATKEFKRNLRRGSSVHSLPVAGKRQEDWPALHRGIH